MHGLRSLNELQVSPLSYNPQKHTTMNNAYGLPAGNPDNPPLLHDLRDGVPSPIDSPAALDAAARALADGKTPIALDVERAHGFRYSTNPYLIQIRREDVGTFLVDPIALPDLSALREGTTDTWILHDASQDLPNLRFVGLKPLSLFDTMIAARLCAYPSHSLAGITATLLGLKLAKQHQANDWSVRPLYTDWLRYAALDVEVLTALKDKLSDQLHTLGRWEWAQQEFHAVMTAPPQPQLAEPWRKNTGVGKLRDRKDMAVFRELWYTRERLAQRLDIGSTRLLRNEDLLRAAQMRPRNRRTLLTIQGFRSPIARQFSDEWLRAIYEASHTREQDLPGIHGKLAPGEIPPATRWKHQNPEGFERLKVVRHVVDEIAGRVGIASEVLLAPKVQRAIAWSELPFSRTPDAVLQRMQRAGARPWQCDFTVSPIAAALGR